MPENLYSFTFFAQAIWPAAGQIVSAHNFTEYGVIGFKSGPEFHKL